MHALDVRRVLSILLILTSRKVEIFDLKIDQNGSAVKRGRKYLKIFCLLKCVLDVAVSVAVSVIVSLLLLSGDIEQNPGPLGGKDVRLSFGGGGAAL